MWSRCSFGNPLKKKNAAPICSFSEEIQSNVQLWSTQGSSSKCTSTHSIQVKPQGWTQKRAQLLYKHGIGIDACPNPMARQKSVDTEPQDGHSPNTDRFKTKGGSPDWISFWHSTKLSEIKEKPGQSRARECFVEVLSEQTSTWSQVLMVMPSLLH